MKYLIVLRGKKDCGKTSTLKKLSKILVDNHKFTSYLIDDCEYKLKEFSEIKEDEDVFLNGKIENKRIIISSGGDDLKCIENFLKKFKNGAFIGITACQCVNKMNKKYKKLINKTKSNEIIMIETTTYQVDEKNENDIINEKLNEIKTNELYELIVQIIKGI